MLKGQGRPNNRVSKNTSTSRRAPRRFDEDQLAAQFQTEEQHALYRAATAAASADGNDMIGGPDGFKGDTDEADGDADGDPEPVHTGHRPHVDAMDHDMPMAPMTPNHHAQPHHHHHHHHHNHHNHHQDIDLNSPEILQGPESLTYAAAAAAASDLQSPDPAPPPVGSTMPAPQPLVAATDFQPNPPPPQVLPQPPPPPPPPQPQPQSQPQPEPAPPHEPGHKTTEQMAHESGYQGFKVDSAFAKRMARDPGQRLAEQRRHGQDLNLVRRSNVEALFAQIAGAEAANPCAHCRKGQGPWTVCVVYSGQMMGSCANCWFNASGSRCSFHEKAQPIAPAQHPYATVPVPVPVPAGGPADQPGGGGAYAPVASPAQLQAQALWNASAALFSHDAGVKGTVQNALMQVRHATPYQRALIEVEVAAKQLALKIVQAEDLAGTAGGEMGDEGQQHNHEYGSPPGDVGDEGGA